MAHENDSATGNALESANAPEVAAAPRNSVAEDATASTSASEVVASPSQMIADGSRRAALKEHAAAAEIFSRAVEALIAQHGELAPEVVDALILYGKALLNNAIANSGVLGNKENGTPNPITAPVAVPPPATSNAEANPNIHFGDEDSDEDDGEDGAEGEEGDGSANQTTVDADDDLETAFGVLDSARVILEKSDTTDSKLKRINVHSLLGDVATENGPSELNAGLTRTEDFDNAVKEYSSALALQKELYEPHDRRMAETHFMIVLALEFVKPVEDTTTASTSTAPMPAHLSALEHAEAAKHILQLKLDHLSAQTGETVEAERKDIAEVMVELDEKIEDLKQRPELERMAAEDKAKAEAAVAGFTPASTSAPVNTLMVKKKKPAPAPAPAPVAPAAAPVVPTAAPVAVVGEKRKAEEDELTPDVKRVKTDA